MSGKNGQLIFELTNRIEGIKRSMNRVTYEAVAAMVMRMDAVSPVGDVKLWRDQKDAARKVAAGYRGGQFRGNWQLGVNQRPTGWFPGNIDPSGAQTVGKNIGVIPAMASRGYKFYLVNNTPYGIALEEGHSSQAPHAFVYRVKREFNGMVRKIAAEIKAEGGRVI
jgi:hypothetical protein